MIGALCATSPTPDDWFAEPASVAGQRAKSLCAQCPVAQACGDAARDRREAFGIWGEGTPVKRLEYGACAFGHPRTEFGQKRATRPGWRCKKCDYYARRRRYLDNRDAQRAQRQEQGVA